MSASLMNKIRKNRLGKNNLPKPTPKPVEEESAKKTEEQPGVETKDMLIQRLAEEELIKEAQRAATISDTVGPTGWLKSPLLKTNKRFLRNTISSAVSHNNYQDRKRSSSSHRETKLSGKNGVHKRRSRTSDHKRDHSDKYKSSHRSNNDHERRRK